MGSFLSKMCITCYQRQYGDQEKLDILYKLDEDPSYQGPGTDQVETWTELNLRGLGCRLPDSIKRCMNLTTLDVSKNHLMEEEHIITIFSLETLEELNMSNCGIALMPPEITLPKHLRKLNLSGNQLTEIPPPVCSLLQLGELNLKNNKITTVSPNLKRLCNLKKLDLSKNPLQVFPFTILEMKTLENLNLAGANITTIPQQIKQFIELSAIDLSNNQLEEFPLSLLRLKTLKTLKLFKSNITTVPPQITQLKNLRELNLSGNQLKEFPMSVCELLTLEILDLSQTTITTVPPQMTQLKNLKKLNLCNNLLEEFPMSVCELVTLETLDLTSSYSMTVPSQITQLKNLRALHLCNNQLIEFPMSVCELVTLETLDIWDNFITTVPPQIAQLKKLKKLNLCNNRLIEFPMSVCELVTLETLELWGNRVTTVLPQITQLKNLKWLDLSLNPLKEFPMSVCKLMALETLHLSKSNITTVPPQITQLKNLKRLSLSLNQLKEFPMSVCKLMALETLHLSKSNITTVPPQITQLKNLKELILSANQLKEFPMSVCELVTLETLELAEDNITTVPPQIKQLKNLKKLDLHINQLEEFPMSICELVTLETLAIVKTNISTVPPQITQLKHLKELIFSSNQLKEFPVFVCELVTLETLNLCNNSISTVPPQITQLKNLKELNLSQNQLKEFPLSLCELVNLETLKLDSNRISQVPPGIKQLQVLRRCYLHINKLDQLPPDVRFLSQLEIFDLRVNKLIQPPQEVADRGASAVKRYFDDLVKTKATSSFRLQVQVIGETCAGKTSLVKTLTSGRPFLTTKADRTHVMEQIAWSPKEDVFLNINDFGGHEVYKVAHNFFVTKEAITLIVFNLQTLSSKYQEAVGSWIDNVYIRAPDSAILLVGTHADCLSKEEVDTSTRELLSALSSHLSDMASYFRTRFEELEKRSKSKESGQNPYKEKVARIVRLNETPPRVAKHVFVISSKNASGIAELEEELIRKAREKNYILPESWLQKVEHIETAKHNEQDPYLTLDSLAEMTQSQMQGGDDAQRVKDVVSFLHATGAVLWFRDKPVLKTFIFHRQDVFIDILKAVLRHDIDSILEYNSDPFNKKFSWEKFESAKNDVLQRGIISRTMLECLWRRFNFGKHGLDAILELFEDFEVCYIVEDANGDQYHFPWLLKEDRPEGISSSWPAVPSRDDFQISLEVHFPVTCPTGLYEMAAVHLHGHLGQFKASRRDWKDGFYAKLDNQFRICFEREVIGAPPNGVIRLSIRGNHPIQLKKYSLDIFRDLLSVAEKECPGSPWDEFLVCPHCIHEKNNPPTLFDTPVSLLSVPLKAPVPYHPCPEEEPECMASADYYYPVTRGKMTDLHYTSLEKHLVQLVDDVRGSRTNILCRLVKARVLTEEEKADLVLGEEDRLIGFLRRKHDSAFYIFCGALHDNGHVETVQRLRLPDMAVMLSEDDFRKHLQRLQSKDVLSQPDIDAVMSEPDKSWRVSALVKKLRENKNSQEAGRAFGEFRDALYDETTRLKELY